MTDEVSPGVSETLLRELANAREASRNGETAATEEALDAVETVASNELPKGDLRDRLLHGCEQADYLAGDEPLAAAEYCRVMRDAVSAATAADDGDDS